jgi:DNA modification methylase
VAQRTKERVRRTQAKLDGAPPPAPRKGPHPKNTLNELSGEEWLYFTKSVLQTSYPSELRHDLRKAHGANKPPRLMRQLIEFFTKRDGLVLDPFAGVGGTLLGAATCDPPRRAVGIEVNPKWVEVYRKIADELDEGGLEGIAMQEMVEGDCVEVMKTMDDDRFDFIATDPPYNIQLEVTMSQAREGKYEEWSNRRTDYNMRSTDARDLANLPTYDAFLDAMGTVFVECARVLKPKGYMALIVRNAYQGGRYMFTHADLARRADAVGLTPKGEIVWWQTGTRLRPYGYPHSYVPNIAHQYIVVMRREPRPPAKASAAGR